MCILTCSQVMYKASNLMLSAEKMVIIFKNFPGYAPILAAPTAKLSKKNAKIKMFLRIQFSQHQISQKSRKNLKILWETN